MKKLIVLVLFVFQFSLILPAYTTQADSSRLAVINSISGSVFIKKSGGEREYKAVNGMGLSQGDYIRTGKDSSANILYDTGSKMSIGSNFNGIITKLENKDNNQKSKVKVWTGKVWNSVKNLLNLNDEFDIETPTTVMGVRGTLFLVSVDSQTGEVKVTVLDGSVGVSQNKDQMRREARDILKNEKIITMNETLTSNSLEEPLPEVEVVKPEELVAEVEPAILVEIVMDVIETAQDASRKAKEQEGEYEESKDKQKILNSLENINIAKSLGNVGSKMLDLIEGNSELVSEYNKVAHEKEYQTLDKVKQDAKTINENVGLQEKEILEKATQAGASTGEIVETDVKTKIPEQEESPNVSEPVGGGETPTAPEVKESFGSNISLADNKPVKFDDGLVVDFGLNWGNISGSTFKVTKEELSSEEVKVAGGVYDFAIDGGSKTFDNPVNIVLPVNEGFSSSNAGVYYFNEVNNQWEYVLSKPNGESHIEADVKHFSVYGVLEARINDLENVKVVATDYKNKIKLDLFYENIMDAVTGFQFNLPISESWNSSTVNFALSEGSSFIEEDIVINQIMTTSDGHSNFVIMLGGQNLVENPLGSSGKIGTITLEKMNPEAENEDLILQSAIITTEDITNVVELTDQIIKLPK